MKSGGEFVVPELKNIDALVTLLQPWLKRKETKVISVDKNEKFTNEINIIKPSEVSTVNTSEPLDNLSSVLVLPEMSKNNKPQAIDLVLYAQNQTLNIPSIGKDKSDEGRSFEEFEETIDSL